MTKFYKLKTPSGFMYTTSNGRYGRVNGNEEIAHSYCEKCADSKVAIMDIVTEHNPDYKVEKVLSEKTACDNRRCEDG